MNWATRVGGCTGDGMNSAHRCLLTSRSLSLTARSLLAQLAYFDQAHRRRAALLHECCKLGALPRSAAVAPGGGFTRRPCERRVCEPGHPHVRHLRVRTQVALQLFEEGPVLLQAVDAAGLE